MSGKMGAVSDGGTSCRDVEVVVKEGMASVGDERKIEQQSKRAKMNVTEDVVVDMMI